MQARLCGSASFIAYITAYIMEDPSGQQDISVGAVYTQPQKGSFSFQLNIRFVKRVN
jgi:hypothetical protein